MAKKASASALKRFEETFEKKFGAGSLLRAGSKYEIISTGSLVLDHAIGAGGLVEGRIVESWGVDDIGKTTFALLAAVEAQKKHPDKQVGYIDMESKFDWPWAIAHGINREQFYIHPPDDAEDVADAVKEMVRSGLFSMVIVDSIGAMIPKEEIAKQSDEKTMGLQAKIVTRMVHVNSVECRKTGTILYLINQVRANLSYGADTTTGGGHALKHSSTLKFKLRKTGTKPYKISSKPEEPPVGHEVAILVERNKVAPRGRTAVVSLFYQVTKKYGPMGIDKASEAANLGIRLKIIKREGKGSWYVLPDGQRFNGQDNVVEALREMPEMVSQIREQILAKVSEDVYDEEQEEPANEDPPSEPKFRKGDPGTD